MAHGISIWTRDENDKQISVYATDKQVVKAFNQLGMPVPEYLAEIMAHGIRYSNQDFDVLSAATRELYRAGINALALSRIQ